MGRILYVIWAVRAGRLGLGGTGVGSGSQWGQGRVDVDCGSAAEVGLVSVMCREL